TDGRSLPFAFENPGQSPGRGRRQFNRGLLAFEDDYIFVLLDEIAFFFPPVTDFNFGDRFANGGNSQFDRHKWNSFLPWLERLVEELFLFDLVAVKRAAGRRGGHGT